MKVDLTIDEIHRIYELAEVDYQRCLELKNIKCEFLPSDIDWCIEQNASLRNKTIEILDGKKSDVDIKKDLENKKKTIECHHKNFNYVYFGGCKLGGNK